MNNLEQVLHLSGSDFPYLENKDLGLQNMGLNVRSDLLLEVPLSMKVKTGLCYKHPAKMSTLTEAYHCTECCKR